MTSVTIPNSVTSIGYFIFRGCSGLTSVTIPESVTTIGYYAFAGCSSLPSISLPNSVEYIEIGAFHSCSSLTSVTIPNNVSGIDNSAFYKCTKLSSVTFGNRLGYIGDEAFRGCSGLTSITIPKSVSIIGEDAFRLCTGLTSIVVESGNTVYDSRNDCNALIETATNTLIKGCMNTVIIPNSVTSIGKNAFQGCIGLPSITIPNSVTSIGNNVFNGCSGLLSVTIPNSVTAIGNSAFYNCSSLTSIIIGNSVTTIGSSAFSNCSSLADVYCKAQNVPDTPSNEFEGSNIENATLHVPDGSISAYQAERPWCDFKSIVAIDESSGFNSMTTLPILVQNNGGVVSIQGADDLTPISVYNINGTLLGSDVSHHGTATISTSLQPGSVAIVKIGDKSVKTVIR